MCYCHDLLLYTALCMPLFAVNMLFEFDDALKCTYIWTKGQLEVAYVSCEHLPVISGHLSLTLFSCMASNALHFVAFTDLEAILPITSHYYSLI